MWVTESLTGRLLFFYFVYFFYFRAGASVAHSWRTFPPGRGFEKTRPRRAKAEEVLAAMERTLAILREHLAVGEQRCYGDGSTDEALP